MTTRDTGPTPRMAEDVRIPEPIASPCDSDIISSTEIVPVLNASIVYVMFYGASAHDVNLVLKEKHNIDVPLEAIRNYYDTIVEIVEHAGRTWYDPVAPASVIASKVDGLKSFEAVRNFLPVGHKVSSDSDAFPTGVG